MATPATLDDAFAVTVNGTANPVEEVDVGGSGVTLVVQNRIAFGDTIVVSYTPPTTSKITDRFGNVLEAFTDETVDNELPDPNDTDPPVFDGAETDSEGREISISFDEDIEASIPPNAPVNVGLLDEGEDAENEHRYFHEYRWSPGEENDQTERDYYEWRIRKVTTPVSAWPSWTRQEAGSVRIGNLDPNSQYEFEVRAGNLGGPSTGTAIITPTPTVVAGLQLIEFQVTNKGRKLDGSTWKYFADFSFRRDPADTGPFTRFEWRRKKTADADAAANWTAWASLGSTTTFSDDTLERNTSYDFQARQVNFIGSSPPAELAVEVTFNVPADLASVTASGSRAGEAGSYTYPLNLEWEKGEETDTTTVDKFRYRYKLDTAANFGSWVDVDKTATTATIAGLTHSVGYDIEFEAVNSAGSSTAETIDSFMIFTKPDAVSNLAGIDFETGPESARVNNVTWAWALPAADPMKTVDDVLTRVREQPAAWGAFVSKGAAATSQTVSNLTSAATHEIQVKTRNNAGDSDVVSHAVAVKILDQAPWMDLGNIGNQITQISSGGIDHTKVKFFEYEYRPNDQTAWANVGPGGLTASNTPPTKYYKQFIPRQGDNPAFHFELVNFEWGFALGSQWRVRGVGAVVDGYPPITLWREGVLPAAGSTTNYRQS